MTTITFPARNGIHNAMIAARTMGAATPKYRNGVRGQCRITANGSTDGINILFTDGNRLGRVQVAGTVTPPKTTIDEPLTPEAVRSLVQASGPEVRIGIGEDKESRVVIDDGGSGEAPVKFPQGYGFDAKNYARVLDEIEKGAAVVCNISRTAALRALREMPRQDGANAVCRLSLRKDGLRAWATDAGLVGPGYPAEAVLATGGVARFEEEIVFGMYRRILSDTLRTMKARKIDILVQARDKPVQLIGTDGREHFVLTTKRLT